MGISQEEKGRSKSLGLVGMRERALIFGGTLEIKGQKGRGTAVFLRLPLKTGNACGHRTLTGWP